jgi:hypothetical protein
VTTCKSITFFRPEILELVVDIGILQFHAQEQAKFNGGAK